MSENILDIRAVSKSYEQFKAVNEVSFAIPKGCIFGMLGPNGAGKSSLIRMITTITRPDSGQILFNGEPLHALTPQQIGYMPEERGLYKKMKVGEQLLYLAQLRGMSHSAATAEVRKWLNRLHMEDWWGKKIEELSKGMQQKIQFIATVVHAPKLLILDEPFSGLDPVNANLLKDEISELHRNGTTIIFSTHRMEQVEEICERIVLINKGQLVLEGEVQEVKQRYKQHLFSIQYEGDLNTAIFQEKANVLTQKDGEITLQLSEGNNTNMILSQLIDNNIKIKAFNEILPSINEIFIKIVGEG